MDSLAISFIVAGSSLTIVDGLPLVCVPSAALRVYDRVFVSTNTRLRALGVLIATVAMELLLLNLSGNP